MNLGELLPAIFSKSDEIKRNLKGLLRNPREMGYSIGEDLRTGNEKNQAAYQALLEGKGDQASIQQAAGLATDVLGGGGGLMGSIAVPKRFLDPGAKTLTLPEAGGKMGQVPMEFGVLPTARESWNYGALPQPGDSVTRAVGEVLSNPALAERFPDLLHRPVDIRNVRGRKDQYGDPLSTTGTYNPVEDRLGVEYNNILGQRGFQGVVEHELSHAIQAREGMSSGSSPDHIRRLQRALFQAREAERAAGMPISAADKELHHRLVNTVGAEQDAGALRGSTFYGMNPGETMASAGQRLRGKGLDQLPESALALDIPSKYVMELQSPGQLRSRAQDLPGQEDVMQIIEALMKHR